MELDRSEAVLPSQPVGMVLTSHSRAGRSEVISAEIHPEKPVGAVHKLWSPIYIDWRRGSVPLPGGERTDCSRLSWLAGRKSSEDSVAVVQPQ